MVKGYGMVDLDENILMIENILMCIGFVVKVFISVLLVVFIVEDKKKCGMWVFKLVIFIFIVRL